MQASPGRPHGWTDPLLAFIHAIGPPLQHRLHDAEMVLDHTEALAEHWLVVVARDARRLADDVIAQGGKVIAWLAALPGIVLLRAKQVVRFVIDVLWFVFVRTPRWLILELPLLTFAAVKRFLEREVIPTSQFLVEVPLGLGSAAVRDLFVRVPVWCAFEGPRALAIAGRWALMQAVVLAVAMFDRVEGLVYKLIDAALLVYDSIYGGIRWVLVAAIFHFAPWLFDTALSGIEHVVSFTRDVVLLAFALRRWLWVQLLLLPGRLTRFVQWAAHTLANVLDTTVLVIESTVEMIAAESVEAFRAIARLLPRLPDFLVSLLAAVGDALLALLHRLGRALVSIGEGIVRLIESLARNTWDLLWFLLVTLPRTLALYAWHAAVSAVHWLLVDLPNLVWATLTFLAVQLPRAIVTAIKEAGRLLWDLSQRVMHPVSTALTWLLAVAIAPFYLIWHLIGLSQPRGGPGRPTSGAGQ